MTQADVLVRPAPAAEPLLVPSRRIKLAYALGQTAYAGAFEAAFGFIFFYYTAVLGLSGAAVGVALAASLAVDAFADPIVGSFSDSLRSRLGRRLPPMIAAIPFMALFMALLFAPPARASSQTLFIWLAFTATAARCAISAFAVPYTALGAELADGYLERSRVVAWRTVVGILANVFVITAAFSFYFSGPGGLQRAAAYPPLGLLVAAFVVVGPSLCVLGLWRHARTLPQPRERASPMLKRLPRELAEVFANSSFRLLFTSAVILYVAIGANATLGSHVNVFIWRLSPDQLRSLALAVLLGVMIGVPLTPLIQRRMEKKVLVVLGVCMLILAWTVLPTLRALGVFTSSGRAIFWPLAGQSLFAGVGIGLAVIAYFSMMADAADEHEFLFGQRREGLYFAGLSFAGKTANGLGVLVGGLALDVIRFPGDAASHPQMVLSEALLRRLIVSWGPAPAAVALVAMGVLLGYRITRVRHDEISASLRARRV